MNTGFLLGTAFGGAFASTLLMFIISALAIQGQRKAKLGWQKTLLFFVVSVAIVTAINVVIFTFNPSLITSAEMSALSIFLEFVIPLLVSIGTLLLLWKPKAS